MPSTTVAAKPLKHLTTRHMERAFGVSMMTLYLWRKGTPTIRPLPTVASEGREVLYAPRAVERWARDNGMTILVPDLAALLVDPALAPRRVGRKVEPRKAPTSTDERSSKPARKPPSKREKVKREH